MGEGLKRAAKQCGGLIVKERGDGVDRMRDCEHGRARDEKHDAYYCPKCGKWLEDVCGDGLCKYCRNRPPAHSIGALSGIGGDDQRKS